MALEALVYELNLEAASSPSNVDREAMHAPRTSRRFVAGILGPTNRTASMSPDVNDPGFRNVSFDELHATYADAMRGLLDGGADLLMVETIFDTLNCKAALFAIEEHFEQTGHRVPVMISATITDLSAVAPSRARPWKPSGIPCAMCGPSASGSTARWAPNSCVPMWKSCQARRLLRERSSQRGAAQCLRRL